jgi:hypothetical protein
MRNEVKAKDEELMMCDETHWLELLWRLCKLNL